MEPYERFAAWRVCHELVLATYRHSARWPVSERYALAAQARRAAFSAAANIAEGSARRGPREFRRFLDITRGSLAELSYVFRVARDLGYLDEPTWSDLTQLRNHAGILCWRLYRRMAPS